MEKMHQMNHSSHAYRILYSMMVAMLQIADNIQQSADNKQISCIMTIDESLVFDCVNHVMLIKKLRMYNLSGNIMVHQLPDLQKWICVHRGKDIPHWIG